MAGTAFLSSASLLVGLQLVSRLFTFVLNQALLRFVSPQAFGTAAIQFELLSSTILFLSREGFRNALLRAWRAHSSNDDDGKGDRVVPLSVSNLSLLPIFIGAPVTVLASAIYRASCSPDTRGQPGFDSAVVIYAFSAIIELLSEPMHIRSVDPDIIIYRQMNK
jgi:oligosaccharide translocation protein RFT1